VYESVEACPRGKLIHYNYNTKVATTLLYNLHFPNGISLTESRDAVIFAESTRFRILKYYLEGPKKGNTEIFLENLPGIPDNIVYSEKSRVYWLGISLKRAKPFFFHRFSIKLSICEKISRENSTKGCVFET